MAERATPKPRPIGGLSTETWTVATFNVVLVSLLGILISYASGGLSDVLGGVGTLPGVAVFGYLWVITVVATRWVFATGGLERIDDGELAALLVRGTVAGALIGMGFLAGILLVAGVVAVVNGNLEILSLALIALIGVAVAGVVGGVSGLVSAVVDAALYRISGVMIPERANG